MSEDRTNEQEADPPEPTDATGATKREGPTSQRSSAKSAREPEQLLRGALVGRYMILDVLGAGGMGVVYSAFDPDLDRKVAIKLLQARGADGTESSGGQLWLVREAQALARLSHPNVIAVHDVGSLADDQVFVAMELVDGTTLRQWLKHGAHTWREIIDVMRAAGAGLAAAHAAGLVHRDFKPDNVLVGNDGRVRVMDFGLARLRAGEPGTDATPASRNSDLQIELRSPLTYDLTEIGTVLGTPAYMAPEIHDGLGADARSDQFAFGIALFEGLYRVRPFDKGVLVPPRATGLAPKQPPDLGVPARLQRAALRAIAIDPAARFATMDELLAELVVEPPASKRRTAIAIGAVAIAIAGGVGAIAWLHANGAQCTGSARKLAGVWDPATKTAVHDAFVATKQPYAEPSFAGLARALDGYTSTWSATVVESCEATRDGTQTHEVQTVRQECLDQRLAELRALTHVLANADAALVDAGDQVVWQLEPIARCSNVAVLLAPNRPTPENKQRYDQLVMAVATAKAQAIAGQGKLALDGATRALDGAHAIHADDLAAQALLVRGTALAMTGSTADGIDALGEAAWSGIRGRRDDVVAQAAISVASATADAAGNGDVAKLWLRLGAEAATRVGIDHELELHELEAEGMIAAQRGDLPAAIAAHQKALAAAKLAYGPDSPALWQVEDFLAASMSKSGALVAAIPYYEHALALREASVGPDHPDVARILSNLGASYRAAGDAKRAIAAFERALASREKTYGPTSPVLVATLNNLADFKSSTGDVAGALVDITRAKQIAEKFPGTAHPLYHTVATTEAEILVAAGKIADARAELDVVLALEAAHHSPMEPTTLASRGALELADHQWTAAVAFDDRAIAGYEAAGGHDDLELWKPLAGLATAKLALDPTADVKPVLERAVAIGTKAQLKNADLAPIKAALAAAHSTH